MPSFQQLGHKVLVTATSPFTNKTHTMIVNCSYNEIERYLNGNKLIQDALPNLTPDEREFIMTGITPQEWNETFKEAK